MMERPDVVGKSLALILWSETAEGEDDVAVFGGTLMLEDHRYSLVRKDGAHVELRPEWLDRIKVVDPELSETLLECEYWISLTVGDADDNDGPYEEFGLKWPDA